MLTYTKKLQQVLLNLGACTSQVRNVCAFCDTAITERRRNRYAPGRFTPRSLFWLVNRLPKEHKESWLYWLATNKTVQQLDRLMNKKGRRK